MMVGSLYSETVALVPGQLKVMQGMDMTLFQITNYALVLRDNENPGKGVKLVVVIKKKKNSK